MQASMRRVQAVLPQANIYVDPFITIYLIGKKNIPWVSPSADIFQVRPSEVPKNIQTRKYMNYSLSFADIYLFFSNFTEFPWFPWFQIFRGFPGCDNPEVGIKKSWQKIVRLKKSRQYKKSVKSE